MSRTQQEKKRYSFLRPSTRCSTSGTIQPPSVIGHRTTSSTALISSQAVKACSISSKAFLPP